MSRGQGSLKDLVEAAAIFVLLIGIVILFLLTDFSSVDQSSDNLTRFIFAVTHIAFPTSKLAVYLEVALAVVGGYSVSRTDVRKGIFGLFALYFLINFIDAWFAAPV